MTADLLDLPDDLHEHLARYLTASDAAALRATCHAFHASYLLLRPHPHLCSLVATLSGSVEELRSVFRRHMAAVPLVSRLVRVGALTSDICTAILEAGFPAQDPTAAADILAGVAIHDRPEMLPMAMNLVLGEFRGRLANGALWTANDAHSTRVSRLALIYEYVATWLFFISDQREAVLAVLVDRYAPNFNNSPDDGLNAFGLLFSLKRTNDESALLGACYALRTILSPYTRPEAGAVEACRLGPYLVALLDHPNREIAHEAAWALGRVISKSLPTKKSAEDMAELGALPLLVRLLEQADIQTPELGELISTLSRFLDGPPECGQVLVEAGLVEQLDRLVTAEAVVSTESAVHGSVLDIMYLLSSLSHKWTVAHNPKVPMLVAILVRALQLPTERTIRKTVLLLGTLVEKAGSNNNSCPLLQPALLEHGAITALVDLLRTLPWTGPNQPRLKTTLLCTIITLGKIMREGSVLCDCALDAGFLDVALCFLNRDGRNPASATLNALSAVTGSSLASLERVMASEVWALVISPGHRGDRSVLVLANAVDTARSAGSDAVVQALVAGENNVIRSMVVALGSPGPDADITLAAIKTLVRLVQYDPTLERNVNEYLEQTETNVLHAAASRNEELAVAVDDLYDLLGWSTVSESGDDEDSGRNT